MRPIRYHEGQRAVQREANSIPCADKLTTWVGPVVQFATVADLIVLASLDAGGLRIAALSGPAPLVEAREEGDEIVLALPAVVASKLPVGGLAGGIVMKPIEARRARLGGRLDRAVDRCELRCSVAFSNCRKYIAPTITTGTTPLLGPATETPIGLGDAWVASTIARAELAFLVTATPDGAADVSHRGGQPGFLRFDAGAKSISWTEYLGDGMFVSTGNLRANGRFALLVVDLATGDALRLDGEGQYANLRADRKTRVDALIQAGEPFPVQGQLTARITAAARLANLCHPRERRADRGKINSTDSTQVQHPQ
jgi:hypothetical protein